MPDPLKNHNLWAVTVRDQRRTSIVTYLIATSTIKSAEKRALEFAWNSRLPNGTAQFRNPYVDTIRFQGTIDYDSRIRTKKARGKAKK